MIQWGLNNIIEPSLCDTLEIDVYVIIAKIKSTKALHILFFILFFGGYQGNTRESGTPWEQAIKHSS